MKQKTEALIEFYLGIKQDKPDHRGLSNEESDELKVVEELIKIHPLVQGER